MGVTTVNFKKVRNNADWRQLFVLKSGVDVLDISTATFEMDVKTSASEPTSVLSLSLGNGLELVTNGADGKLLLNVDQAEVATITLGKYKYDIRMTRGSASEIIFEGYVKFVDGVTDL